MSQTHHCSFDRLDFAKLSRITPYCSFTLAELHWIWCSEHRTPLQLHWLWCSEHYTQPLNTTPHYSYNEHNVQKIPLNSQHHTLLLLNCPNIMFRTSHQTVHEHEAAMKITLQWINKSQKCSTPQNWKESIYLHWYWRLTEVFWLASLFAFKLESFSVCDFLWVDNEE